MVATRMRMIDFIKQLQSFDREYFSMADLEKITGQSRDSLKVTLNRLTKVGVLVRLKKGIYQLSLSSVNIKKIANQLYYPSYLSFESALSHYGILSQVPYTQTFATSKKSKKITLGKTEVEFTQIKKELFFGYTLEDDIYIALPEKALLDQIYMVSRGKRNLNIEELDLKNIDKKKFADYASKFPDYMNELVKRILKLIGTTAITDEDKERISWNKK